jgi:hypothetical protein
LAGSKARTQQYIEKWVHDSASYLERNKSTYHLERKMIFLSIKAREKGRKKKY